MIKLYKWFIAYATSRPVWRVTYQDGKRTRLLSESEAVGLSKVFGGKMWIDYKEGYF